MMRSYVGLFCLVTWGCTPGPAAPQLDVGIASSDIGMHLDAGSNPEPFDAGMTRLRDSGQAANDVQPPMRGQVDAGFDVPVPELPQGDACAEVCAHTDCQEECLSGAPSIS